MEIVHGVPFEGEKQQCQRRCCSLKREENPSGYNVVGILPEEPILSGIDRMLYFLQSAALCMNPVKSDSVDCCSSPSMETARSRAVTCKTSSTLYAEPEGQSVSCLPSDRTCRCQGFCCCRTRQQNIIAVPDDIIHSPEEPILSSIDKVLYLFSPRPVCRTETFKCHAIDACTNTARSTNSTEGASSRCSVGIGTGLSLCKLVASSEPPQPSCCALKAVPKRFTCSSGALQQKKKVSMCSTNSLSKRNYSPRSVKYDFCHDSCSTKWSWTRISTFRDGSKIYEVFDHVPLTKPTARLLKTQPKMIIAILPNGTAIPFQCI